MKIFTLIQTHYATLGIDRPSNQSTQTNPINNRILFGFSLFGCLISSQFVYIFCVANGFMDYIVCTCVTSESIIICVCLAAIVFRKAKLFGCIDNIEKLTNASEPIFNSIDHYFIDFLGQTIQYEFHSSTL